MNGLHVGEEKNELFGYKSKHVHALWECTPLEMLCILGKIGYISVAENE